MDHNRLFSFLRFFSVFHLHLLLLLRRLLLLLLLLLLLFLLLLHLIVSFLLVLSFSFFMFTRFPILVFLSAWSFLFHFALLVVISFICSFPSFD